MSHYNKKKTCIAHFEDISIEKCLEELNKPKKSSKCEFCDKSYCRPSYLKKHYEVCKARKITLEKNKEIEMLKSQVGISKQNKIDGNNNVMIGDNSNNKTVNINFNMNTLVEDNKGKLLIHELKECLANNSRVPEFSKLLENVFYNPRLQENHSILLKDFNRGYIETYQDGEFIMEDTEFVDNLLLKLEELIKQEILDRQEIKKYLYKLKQHLKYKEDDGNEYTSGVTNDMKRVMKNKKKCVKNTHNDNIITSN